jgi:hydrogenase nickel incorporation protein HypB
MCQECGCSKPGPYQINGQPADDTPAHTHTLADGTVVTHTHDHGHDHPHEAHAHEHDAVPTHPVS